MLARYWHVRLGTLTAPDIRRQEWDWSLTHTALPRLDIMGSQLVYE